MIEIFWEKVVIRGVQKYKITRFYGFKTEEELPIEYVSFAPYILPVIDENDLDITVCTTTKTNYLPSHNNNAPRFYLTIGATYTEEQMTEALSWMVVCGTKLYQINQVLKNKNADWHGTGSFEILR